jgi:acyl-CoA synthetase (NDP forming)
VSETAAPHELQRLLRPRSVAVVGASPRASGFPARALNNLLHFGFPGAVYPVNPKYEELRGLTCYPSLKELPEPVDLALVLVPAAGTTAVIEECGQIGAGGAVVFSSGFAELGEEGRAEQQRMADAARAGGLRVLGPNCQGLINRQAGLVATFTRAVDNGLGRPSGIAYVGQSGAVGGSFLGMARARGTGLSAWASTGNQADLTATEVASALIEEPGVTVVAMYLEAVPEGAAWRRLARRAAEADKKLVVLRSGQSVAGQRAAASHTGAMLGPDVAFELIARDHGAVRVDDVGELLDTAESLARGRRMTGPGVAVVTSSGGAGSLAADHLDRAGMAVPELAPSVQEPLRALIPPYGAAGNPVDVTAQLFTRDDDAFADVCRLALAGEDIHALMVVLTNLSGEAALRFAQQVIDATADSLKPAGVVWLAAHDQTAEARLLLREAGIPVYDSIAGQVATLARLRTPAAPVAAAGAHRDRGLAALLPGEEGPWVITEAAGAALLDALGIARPRALLVDGPEAAAAAAGELGGDLVLKVQSAQITHKSEHGGVRLAVGAAQAADAFRGILAAVGSAVPDAEIDGVLVQRRAEPGTELIVGAKGAWDGYPPVITVGIGGVTTELYADVASALAPLTPEGAAALLRRLRGWPLLAGYRGRPGADVPAAARAVAAVSEAAAELGPRLGELEINPLLVHEHGVSAVDLLVRLV